MKKIFKFVFVGLSIALIAPSCSIEKRVHTPGYHITWSTLNNGSNDGKSKAENSDQHEQTTLARTEKTQAVEVKTSNRAAAAETTKISPSLESTTVQSIQANSANKFTVAASETTKSVTKKTVKSFAHTAAIKKAVKQAPANDSDDELILLYLLAILIPFVAVGIVTDWDLTDVAINLLLSFLCYIPGVIHAFIKIRDNR
jgi:uncharacterized membrane protein YqaE (UPF0057 family)